MKIFKIALYLSVFVVGVGGYKLFAGKRNRSDLYTTGMSDAFQNPDDSFDELRTHNHSVNGDNIDWRAHPYHTDRTCARCKKYSTQVVVGYQAKKHRTCATCN